MGANRRRVGGMLLLLLLRVGCPGEGGGGGSGVGRYPRRAAAGTPRGVVEDTHPHTHTHPHPPTGPHGPRGRAERLGASPPRSEPWEAAEAAPR